MYYIFHVAITWQWQARPLPGQPPASLAPLGQSTWEAWANRTATDWLLSCPPTHYHITTCFVAFEHVVSLAACRHGLIPRLLVCVVSFPGYSYAWFHSQATHMHGLIPRLFHSFSATWKAKEKPWKRLCRHFCATNIVWNCIFTIYFLNGPLEN